MHSTLPVGLGLAMAQAMQTLFLGPVIPVHLFAQAGDSLDLVLRLSSVSRTAESSCLCRA